MQHPIKQLSFPVSLLIIASILVFVSFPRFIASIRALYPEAVIVELSAGQELPEKTFLKAQNNLVSAIKWLDSSSYWRNLSDLKFKYFLLHIADLENIDETLAETSATTDLALSLMPVAPYTWYDRAVIHSMDEERVENTLESLAMSVYVDRLNKNLLKARVLFLWGNIDRCNEELRSIFKSQLLLLWEFRRRQLIVVLRANPEMGHWLVDSLSNSPDEQEKLDRLLKNN